MNDLEVLLEVSELTGRTVTRLYSDMSPGELRMWHAVFNARDRALAKPAGPRIVINPQATVDAGPEELARLVYRELSRRGG